jgi:biotin transport system substrate-specific component
MSTIELSFPRRRVLADIIPKSLLTDTVLVIGFAGLVGALAQFSIHLRFTPVPITGQTLGVLLAGAALGWRRAFLSMSLYFVAGLAGVPWFLDHSSTLPMIDAGYVVGFIATGTLLGWLASRGLDRNVWSTAGAMILGELLLYAIAVPWLAIAAHISLEQAFIFGMRPFIAGDAIKAGLAGLALPATWRLVDRTASSGDKNTKD